VTLSLGSNPNGTTKDTIMALRMDRRHEAYTAPVLDPWTTWVKKVNSAYSKLKRADKRDFSLSEVSERRMRIGREIAHFGHDVRDENETALVTLREDVLRRPSVDRKRLS